MLSIGVSVCMLSIGGECVYVKYRGSVCMLSIGGECVC